MIMIIIIPSSTISTTNTPLLSSVPPKAKGRRARDTARPISGLDVSALLGAPRTEPITRDSAIPAFRRTLAANNDTDAVADAARQMAAVICGLVTDSLGDALYARAVETLAAMRDELIVIDQPRPFNAFARDFRMRLRSGEFGGDRRDFWIMMKRARLGLVTKMECDASSVTAEEAEEFYKTG